MNIAFLAKIRRIGPMEKAEIKKNSWVAWSEDEIKLLKKLFPRGRARELAEQTGRTVRAIACKAQRLGLGRSKPVWSKKELNLLKKLYPSRTAQQIADQIGRTVLATQLRIAKLGLKKRRQKAKM